MKIVRTYPFLHPEKLRGRARVEDELPRCFIDQYDNSPLTDFKDDLVILEWDIAVSREDLELFCATAGETPDKVMVAPYRMYSPSDARYPDRGVYAHRIVTHSTTWQTRFVTGVDYECDLFGLGMAYLPHVVLKDFVNAHTDDKRMTDANLSMWHYRQGLGPVAINWAVNAVHLNYKIPTEYPFRKEAED